MFSQKIIRTRNSVGTSFFFVCFLFETHRGSLYLLVRLGRNNIGAGCAIITLAQDTSYLCEWCCALFNTYLIELPVCYFDAAHITSVSLKLNFVSQRTIQAVFFFFIFRLIQTRQRYDVFYCKNASVFSFSFIYTVYVLTRALGWIEKTFLFAIFEG